MRAPIIAPRSVAIVIRMKYPIESIMPLIMKVLIPNSGAIIAGVARKEMKIITKNIVPRKPPISALPTSEDVSPIGMETMIGMKNRNVAEFGQLVVTTLE